MYIIWGESEWICVIGSYYFIFIIFLFYRVSLLGELNMNFDMGRLFIYKVNIFKGYGRCWVVEVGMEVCFWFEDGYFC